MSTSLTVQEILARLERQVAHHQEQAAVHEERERYHREQREEHVARAAEAVQRLEAFRAAASPAMELASRPAPAPVKELPLQRGRRPPVQQMVAAAVRAFESSEPFGATKVLQEIRRRHGQELQKMPEPDHVSIALQRLAKEGRIHQLRRGRPHHEAMYSREAERRLDYPA
jgi:hypothetical protein